MMIRTSHFGVRQPNCRFQLRHLCADHLQTSEISRHKGALAKATQRCRTPKFACGAPRGFTLIELTIVVGILTILSLAVMGLFESFHTNIFAAREHSNAQTTHERIEKLWRGDVLQAERIQLISQLPDLTTATMARVWRGDGQNILWSRGTDPKRIERRVEHETQPTIEVFPDIDCTSLEFSTLEEGRIVEIRWVSDSGDGIRRFQFEKSVRVAPLNPVRAEEGARQ